MRARARNEETNKALRKYFRFREDSLPTVGRRRRSRNLEGEREIFSDRAIPEDIFEKEKERERERRYTLKEFDNNYRIMPIKYCNISNIFNYIFDYYTFNIIKNNLTFPNIS